MRLLDLLLPQRCAACGGGETIVCDRCRASLTLLRGPICGCCGAPTAWPVERCAECAGRRLPFRSARAAVAYEGRARTLVAAWKERGLRTLTLELAELVILAVPRPPAEVLTFIPADSDRNLWRGQNAAEALARALGERWHLRVAHLLERTRRTPRQRGLSRKERRANVRHAFVAARAAPAAVAVIDDVYTTGATVAAATGELCRAGAHVVDVVTFARAVRW